MSNAQYWEWKVVSEQCQSVNFWGEPWFPLEICSNSNSIEYQGSYSQKYICDEANNAINISFYWGYDCLATPEFSEQILNLDTFTQCEYYNYSFFGDYYYSDYLDNYYDEWTYDNLTGDYTVFWKECYNYTDATANCDTSLPICNFANYSTFTPLPDEPSCSTDEALTNWASNSHVIGQCECMLTNVSNAHCYTKMCNESGIFAVYLEDVDFAQYTLDPASICDIDWNDHNQTLGAEFYVFHEDGCEDDEYTKVYCQDSKAFFYDGVVAYFVVLIGLMRLCVI